MYLLLGSSTTTLDGVKFEGNRASQEGGAIIALGSVVRGTNLAFDNNSGTRMAVLRFTETWRSNELAIEMAVTLLALIYMLMQPCTSGAVCWPSVVRTWHLRIPPSPTRRCHCKAAQ
jgi:predicted outer membrane repeat protein